MVFEVGDKVKIKKCTSIESDYWGILAIITKEVDSEGKVEIRYPMEINPQHINFKCKIECLENLE